MVCFCLVSSQNAKMASCGADVGALRNVQHSCSVEVLEHGSLYTFARSFSAYIHCHIFNFNRIVCLIFVVAWVALSCPELHWSCCSDLEQMLWPCGVGWMKIEKSCSACGPAHVHQGVANKHFLPFKFWAALTIVPMLPSRRSAFWKRSKNSLRQYQNLNPVFSF